MSAFVVRCAGAAVPTALAALPITQAATVPTEADLDELLLALAPGDAQRLIVLGQDAALAAVLTYLLRQQRLTVEIGYVPRERTYGARAYRTGTGSAAAKRAVEGTATPAPLIRDDTARVLVGRATVTGIGGAKLTGEAYLDDVRLFTGKVAALKISPTLEQPGVRAAVQRGLHWHHGLSGRRVSESWVSGRWVSGRAIQLGSSGAMVAHDGITSTKAVPRVVFYRHDQPWMLVR